jgi:hypothetical protein
LVAASPTAHREPPPLPYHLQTSGVRWLIAAAVLVALTIAVFARGLRGPAITVTVVDDAVVRWLAGLDAPGLVGLWRALAAIGSWWVLNGLALTLLLALLVLKRFRQLIVFLIIGNLTLILAQDVVAALARRPRPFGVDIQAGWGVGHCRRFRSPRSRPRWSRSCTRWCRRAAGAILASGSRRGWWR